MRTPTDPRTATSPGDGLLRVVPIVALVLLVLNDHWWKAAAPGLLTGKLSDLAGMAVFPLVLVAAFESIRAILRRPHAPSHRHLAVAVVATGIVFALVKLHPAGTGLVAWALGAGQWFPSALGAAAAGASTPYLRPVAIATDPGDLIALSGLLLAWIDGRRRLAPRSPSPNGGGIRTSRRLVAPLVLAIAGVASIATSPAQGPVGELEVPFSSVLTTDAPVAIRDISFTLDKGTMSAGFRQIWLSALTYTPGVRLVLVDADGGYATNAHEGPTVYDASLYIRDCPSSPCTRVYRLIAELTDPTKGPVTMSGTFTARAEGAAIDEKSVPAGALVLTGLDKVKAAGPPHVTTSDVTHEDVLDADHTIVEHRVSVRMDPGAIPDRTMVMAEAWIRVQAVDGQPPHQVSAKVDNQEDRFDVNEAPNEEHLRGGEIRTPNGCVPFASCETDHLVGFTAAQGLDRPTTVRWTVTASYTDYGEAAPPSERTTAVGLVSSSGMGDDVSGPSHSLAGQLQVDADNRGRGEVDWVITPNQALTDATPDASRRLVMRQILTVTAVEASGPHVRGKHLRVNGASEIDADGVPHVLRFDQLITCAGRAFACGRRVDVYGPELFVDITTDPGMDKPITVDWTLETTFVPFGENTIPPGADFTIAVKPPQP